MNFAQRIIEGSIDFVGQQTADSLSIRVIWVSTVVAFLAGLVTADISVTVYICAFAYSAGFIFVVLPWPFYNRNPLKWLEPAAKN
ncbi:microsomal signal peptidase 12kDa subunit [Limtongia smithiae]|uniref:microsomal signal peptidase 12kDa subunit n=1 Tax=Limtongia smithiae TaxID=1125753 RepID=UPI0034CF8F2C